LLQANAAGHIDLFDRDTWKVAAILFGHRSSVTGLAFSRDGKNLLSSSSDGTVRVWGIPAP
jgi:WD40 repeat protein